jgi:hypothetical protein
MYKTNSYWVLVLKESYFKLSLGIIFITCLITNLKICRAEVVWSDNFDDGDISDWMIAQGRFTVENGSLQSVATGTITLDYSILSQAFHPSKVYTGTWSFDYKLEYSSTCPELAVNFIGVTATVWDISSAQGKDYGFYLGWYRPGEYELYKNMKFPGAQVLSLCSSDSSYEKDVWHHVDITRGEDGRFCVYVDGVLGIDLVDKEHMESNYFGVYLEYSDRGRVLIDNIVVSDTVDIDPPEFDEPGLGMRLYQIGVFSIVAIVIGLMVRAARK